MFKTHTLPVQAVLHSASNVLLARRLLRNLEITFMPDEPTSKSDRSAPQPPSTELRKTILGSSLQMIGVSLTVAGVFRGVQAVGKVPVRADNILSLVAVMFLLAWIFAYLAQRSRPASSAERVLETIADGAFLLALCLIVVSVALIAFEIV
ncbi:MAG: hypothetical protein HC933_06730 [Pleurocapsa sp. SU_196_0]|nr:hypothetical protein [Pleurocapsa sp. SU_196_0]